MMYRMYRVEPAMISAARLGFCECARAPLFSPTPFVRLPAGASAAQLEAEDRLRMMMRPVHTMAEQCRAR